jgi:adenylosuccinate lyase
VTAATQWLERTLDDSANRRLSIPDAYLALDGALVLTENVVRGLTVNPDVVRRNLAEHLPFMATETILMQAVLRGGDRQALHERIRRHSHAAAGQMKEGRSGDLPERIAADDAFGMTLQEVRSMIDPTRFVGRAPEQVDRFLRDEVDPLLAELQGASSVRPGAEVRV